ncbi:hypothetical protein SAMN05660662_3214 [Blastococcus aurantiacus]|uniref:Uncharacterized protein n=1 Tax=Blastococcus aurantiacus TaxID=1550231 RepID=A0A1G7NKF9_9ACTN|nr:hypothetical protein [Blastococcus aurantiacus]SDF74538.1 hypothetical protein SAMN05660662_3214 [Blastococcus aurantiacus]
MEWFPIVLAVAVVVATALYLRRRRPSQSWPDELPDGRLDRGRIDGPDARGAISKHSWMLGGGGSGG